MSRAEIKEWAKGKLKENFWPICGTTIVAAIITSFTIVTGKSYDPTYGVTSYDSISLGWAFYFVSVGLAYYIGKLIKNENAEFNDLFHFSKDFLRCLGASLLQVVCVLIGFILLVIPGIILSFSFALVPYLLADEKYKDVGVVDILKKSYTMMKGHKMDFFILALSFFFWSLLIIVTFGIAALYVIPYMELSFGRFLYNVKLEAEGVEVPRGNVGLNENANPSGDQTVIHNCPQCGSPIKDGSSFCSQCGYKI